MPRASSASHSHSRPITPRTSIFTRSSTPTKTQHSVPVTPAAPIAVPTPQTIRVEQPGFFSNIMQGFGLGTGQAVAHNLFRSNPVVNHTHETPAAYTQCMKERNDFESCKEFLNQSSTSNASK